MRLILFMYTAGAICFYDSKTPDYSRIHDTRPRLTLSLTGFHPGSRAYVRYWEGTRAYAYPSDYALYIDAAGKLLSEIVLTQGVASADVLIYVDQSGNGILDAADFGTWQTALPIDTNSPYTYLNIAYSPGTLSAYNTTAALPSAGQKICMYNPAIKPAWNTALLSAIPKYPEMTNATLTMKDWFPVSIVTTGGITQKAPLISALGIGAYNETCVLDANGNGIYDSGDTVGSTIAVP